MCGSVNYNPEPVDCNLGIYKIWVSKSSRRQGIATKLLDAAFKDSKISKDKIAFSQPSESGRKLATSFFKKSDFLIY